MKIGDYVRTNSGDIGIIINCPEQLKKDYGNWLWFETINEQRPIRNEDIIKSSPNIIYLIEVGDYVNGYPVFNIEFFEDGKFEIELSETYYVDKVEDIKSIVTKESFESMEYKVGEQ